MKQDKSNVIWDFIIVPCEYANSVVWFSYLNHTC